jgi:hypothetical protein
MSILSSHQSHMNITESRRHAVKILTRETGMTFMLNNKKTPKSHVVMAIKSGYLDGYFYRADYDNKLARISAWEDADMLHTIGN